VIIAFTTGTISEIHDGFVFMGGRLMDVCHRTFDMIDYRFCMFLGWIWRKGWISMGIYISRFLKLPFVGFAV
jgi:hypothetical protein